ncbi:patatin-like phospholipase family protein [Thermodesulfobacteriota bacterium]
MTILKMGFAMGGGIALGTFNGATLSEAVKLAIIYGRDQKEEPFDKVEIDVFSGASAGAMSLGLMVRALVEQSDEKKQAAKEKLITQFGDDYTNLNDAQKDDLIAAQVLQDIQYEAWVKDISLDALLSQKKDEGSPRKTLKKTAGILNRAAVDETAIKHFSFGTDNLDIASSKRLLADRVLYASSLSNLTPIIQDARSEFNVSASSTPVLNDGMTSRTHREMRIFDLYLKNQEGEQFDNETVHPSRWIRYHLGQRKEDKVGNLNDSKKAWAKIAATAVSSGAFPFAFEPVVLERSRFEFGNKLWPKELEGKMKTAFTYSDGGTFNNEPIREAFRMGAFIDAHDDRPDTERWIVFVDPYISKLKTNFRVPVHQMYELDDPVFGSLKYTDGFDLEPQNALDRILGHAGNLLASISNQSRALEGDKIFQIRQKFSLRDSLRKNIKVSAVDEDERKIKGLKAFVKQIEHLLASDKENSLIPAGALTIEGELKRILREETDLRNTLGSQNITQVLIMINNMDNSLANKNSWHQALSFVLLDLTMNLGGKSSATKLVAIGPIKNPSNDLEIETEFIELPGGKLGAFGGFMYQGARHMDTEIGKWCAHKFLHAAGLIDQSKIPAHSPPSLTATEEYQEEEYQKKLKVGTKRAVNRLLTMISDGHIPVLSAIPKPIFSMFVKSKIMKMALTEENGQEYEFRIKVPKDKKGDFEWDGPGFVPMASDKDIATIKIDGEYYLVTFARYHKKKWSGLHVDGTKGLKVDKDGLFVDTVHCHIKMPTEDHIKQADILNYPVFVNEIDGNEENDSPVIKEWQIKNLAKPLHEEFQLKLS